MVRNASRNDLLAEDRHNSNTLKDDERIGIGVQPHEDLDESREFNFEDILGVCGPELPRIGILYPFPAGTTREEIRAGGV